MATHSGQLIVMVEDDDDYVQSVVDRLEWQGFSFVIACTGDEGMRAVREHLPDLVILDLQLTKKLEGLSVLQALRADPATAAIPVIIHSVWANEKELRTRGIDQGAWYCLDKNDSLRELEACVHRALAISGSGAAGARRLVPVDYDDKTGTVWLHGAATPIKLSRQQALLLALLVRRAGRICSRDAIAREVYRTSAITNEPIDRLVSRLREKLGDAEAAQAIEAVRGIGYKLASQPLAPGA